MGVTDVELGKLCHVYLPGWVSAVGDRQHCLAGAPGRVGVGGLGSQGPRPLVFPLQERQTLVPYVLILRSI